MQHQANDVLTSHARTLAHVRFLPHDNFYKSFDRARRATATVLCSHKQLTGVVELALIASTVRFVAST
jgi:hypothetical protein